MSSTNDTPKSHGDRIAVILAGGGGRRMGGADKGELILGGRRLLDHLLTRLKPQVDLILISGAHDYGSGHTVVSDREDGPRGPAAGLWAALNWIDENAPQSDGFLTAPVDGPFLAEDLFGRLSDGIGSVIACDAKSIHPTFAYWRCDALGAALADAPKGYGFPLKELADSVHAERVQFEDETAFLNINSPEDLARAEAKLRDQRNRATTSL